jgi:hypothetical protein
LRVHQSQWCPHRDRQNEERSTQVSCPVCGIEFKDGNSLKSHIPSHPVEANRARIRKFTEADENENVTAAEDPTASIDPTLSAECHAWESRFSAVLNECHTPDFNLDSFDKLVAEFLSFLHQANSKLPGPKHPAVKMFQIRRRQKENFRCDQARQSESSNPARADRKARQRRRQKYEHELAQYYFFNQRKKAARMVMGESSSQASCPIEMNLLSSHFKSLFGTKNSLKIECIHPPSCQPDIQVELADIHSAIKAISMDTAPGLDRIISRTVKTLNCAPVIKCILEIMLVTGHTPSKLAEGRTILIHKSGNQSDLSNWRPITIYSIVRRIIEKVLDNHLRSQISLNSNQRGFVKGIPGAHINSILVNACLKKAKDEASDAFIIFLDISKAFDSIGHEHIQESLKKQGVSSNLSRIVMSLLQNNQIRVCVGRNISEPILIKRSVPQGGPLSPLLFNLAIDFIYNEITQHDFANTHGFPLTPGCDALSLTGFADDQVITSNTLSGATRIAESTQDLFQRIGLVVNPKKSVAIVINKGQLSSGGSIALGNGETIRKADKKERIRYLGCSFTSEIVFDHRIIIDITKKINNMITSSVLSSSQKISIMNRYLFPLLVYPLQTAPLIKIPKNSLETLDKTIRCGIKAIIGLPTSTSTGMIYAPKNMRGLAAIKCEWEAFIQHYAMADKLEKVDDQRFQAIFNAQEEKRICLERLQVNQENQSTQAIRKELRMREYNNWCSLAFQGLGAKHFNNTSGTKKLFSSLSSSEHTAAVKLNVNYANLRGVPGVHQPGQSNKCRRCHINAIETPKHISGSCPAHTHRRTARHHRIKHLIAESLKSKGLVCYDEVQCRDSDGCIRFVDILAIDPTSKMAYIVDPTVRYETNEDIDSIVQEEKSSIYDKCHADLKEKYGIEHIRTIGLWVGARGTIPKGLLDFWNEFKLEKALLDDIAQISLLSTIKMIHHHIYS